MVSLVEDKVTGPAAPVANTGVFLLRLTGDKIAGATMEECPLCQCLKLV